MISLGVDMPLFPFVQFDDYLATNFRSRRNIGFFRVGHVDIVHDPRIVGYDIVEEASLLQIANDGFRARICIRMTRPRERSEKRS